MKYCLFLFLIFLLACSQPGIEFKTDNFKMSLDNSGIITSLNDNAGNNYVPMESRQSLVQVRVGGQYFRPTSVSQLSEGLLFEFENGSSANVKVEEKATHLTFELTDLNPLDSAEVFVWGPIHTKIDSIIGETVGVVRGPEYAIGIQSLNIKTLGGYPWKENDAMPQMDIFDGDDFSDLSEQGKRYVLYRVEAAKPEDFGSSLQAYARNRITDRVIENWNHDYYTAPAWDDEGVIGSKIALFGVPVDKTLETLEAIEIAEDLPHPVIDGEWGKTAVSASAAYLILDFTEENIDRCIEYTRQAGLKYLYHSGPFESWGKFNLKESDFPNGVAGMKAVVEKAEAAGVHLGVHTLSNFITTNDPYVTPIPDPRLAVIGESSIVSDLSDDQTTIEITDPKFFDQFRNNHLKTVRIGSELIRYGQVSKEAPYQLLDCQRGSFGTTASEHSAGSTISKLADHGYKVFLSNADLTIEMAENLAELYNETGLRQISFDGLEGNRSTGMGNYGETLMTYTWYQNLSNDIKSHYIADASRTTHFFWHIFSRMNWGEPWYAGFRESQTEYRLKNQVYFNRNMIPAMLGWFLLRPNTSLEDMEWLLAKSAAFNAGYSFVCNFESLESNGQTDQILELIRQYESLRMNEAFSASQREAMMDPSLEFHLEYRGIDDWDLYQYSLERITHSSRQKQPGEPTGSQVTLNNPFDEQPVGWVLRAPEESSLRSVSLEVDNYKTVTIPVTIPAGFYLKYTGGSEAILYDQNWSQVDQISIEASDLTVGEGEHTIIINADFEPGDEHELSLEVKVMGKIE